eukprot:scaffold90301_cov19-Tisochrysis_lutea.AAC.1
MLAIMFLQFYEEGQPKGDAHAALLHLARLRMADACYSLLLTSAEAYASSLETFQVGVWAGDNGGSALPAS